MITVYGRATSSNVQIVMWAIGELGLAHERRDIGHSYGGNDTAEYLSMNPMGLVPTIRDGDLVMWESGAIMRYLAAKYGDEVFWPRDPATRARLDMWAEWCKTTFGPTFNGKVFFPSVRIAPSKQNKEAIAKGVEEVKPLARLLDRRIGEGPWLAGEHFTFADILTGNLLYRYFELDFERTRTPALRAYYDRLKARSAYAEHNCVSYEPLRARED
jgi:glutathione S-transferase